VLNHQSELDSEARLQVAFQLVTDGLEIMRQNLRRANPAASEEKIEQMLVDWLASRRGAEAGDIDDRFATRRAI
jgi:hypothetical protein